MKLIKIFDMDNEKQRDSCLKEVQLHQVSICDFKIHTSCFFRCFSFLEKQCSWPEVSVGPEPLATLSGVVLALFDVHGLKFCLDLT